MAVASPPPISAVPELDLLEGKVLPIEAYKLTPEKLRQLNNAQTRLANRCLTRFGFPPSLPLMDQSAASVDLMSRRYGITDPAVAERYGYRAPDGDDGTRRPPSEPVSEELSLVLYGVADTSDPGQGERSTGLSHNGIEIPAGGCMGESKRRLRVDVYERADPGGLAGDIEMAAGRQADADERVKGKIAEWSACMKEKGYDFKGPFDPVEAAQGGTVTAAEIQTAVTDVECKRRVNLVGVWFTVEVAYEQALIEKNQERLDDIRKRIDDMLTAAAAVPA